MSDRERAAYNLGQRHRREGRREMPETVPAELAEFWRSGWYGVEVTS